MTQEEREVLDCFLSNKIVYRGRGPDGKFNNNWNHSDRKFREIIASLQIQGHAIVSLKKGYKLGTTEEVDAYSRREYRRAYSIINKIRFLKKGADDVARQMEMNL